MFVLKPEGKSRGDYSRQRGKQGQSLRSRARHCRFKEVRRPVRCSVEWHRVGVEIRQARRWEHHEHFKGVMIRTHQMVLSRRAHMLKFYSEMVPVAADK